MCSHLKGRVQDVVIDVHIIPLGGGVRFRYLQAGPQPLPAPPGTELGTHPGPSHMGPYLSLFVLTALPLWPLTS